MVAFYLDDAALDNPPLPPDRLRIPTPDGSGVTLTYDDIIDSLMILVDDSPGVRVVEPVNTYASLLINERDEVVGATIDAFLTQAVYEHPELRAIADYMRLGSRPHGDTSLFRTDRPERPVRPDSAWHDRAAFAIRELFTITGGYED